jgi:hypothetical protein
VCIVRVSRRDLDCCSVPGGQFRPENARLEEPERGIGARRSGASDEMCVCARHTRARACVCVRVFCLSVSVCVSVWFSLSLSRARARALSFSLSAVSIAVDGYTFANHQVRLE